MSENHAYRHMVEGPKPHTHSVYLYWGVFAALVFLTFITVYLAKFDFGELSIVVTLLIAGTKACLVFAIFMHMAFDSKLYSLMLSMTLIFLGLFLLFPLLDVDSRDWVVPERDNFLPRNEMVYQNNLENPKALPMRPGLKKAEEDKLIFLEAGEH